MRPLRTARAAAASPGGSSSQRRWARPRHCPSGLPGPWRCGRAAPARVRARGPAAPPGLRRHRQPRPRHAQDLRRDEPDLRRGPLRRRPRRAAHRRGARAVPVGAAVPRLPDDARPGGRRIRRRRRSRRRTTRTSRWRCTRWPRGKHVYLEKPLAHTFREVDLLIAMAARSGVVTQMGNQGHSGNNYFQFKAWTEAGIIKDVTKIVMFMNSERRWHGWKVDGFPSGEPMPPGLDWDLWHGARPVHPFSTTAAPADLARLVRLRQRAPSATGARTSSTPPTGSWTSACRTRSRPSAATSRARSSSRRRRPSASTSPRARASRPSRCSGTTASRTGRRCPPNSGRARCSRRRPASSSTAARSSSRAARTATRCASFPRSGCSELAPSLPKIAGGFSDHATNFVLACQGKEESRSPFRVSGPLTQVFLLGVIAQRLGGRLEFDPARRVFTDNAEATALLAGPAPRAGWERYYRGIGDRRDVGRRALGDSEGDGGVSSA